MYNVPTYLYDHLSAGITLSDVPPQVFRPTGEDVTMPPACKACSIAQPHWSSSIEHPVDLLVPRGSVF